MAHLILCLRNQCSGRSIALPTSAAAAVALLAIDYNHHMAHFARGKVRTVEDMPIHNNAASHACAKRNGNEIFYARACARFRLTIRRAVSVVFQIDRLAKAFTQHFLRRDVLEIQVI